MKRIITRSMDRMTQMNHLPQDLVTLLGQTAALQAEERDGLNIDLSGMDLPRSPLCRPKDFPLDRAHFKALAGKVLELILALNQPPAMAGAAETIVSAINDGSLDLEAAFKALGSSHSTEGTDLPGDVLAKWAEKTPDAPAALPFVITAAAAPGLEAAAGAMAEAAGLNPEEIRPKGACPVCGSLPYMLELKEKEGQRFAHCAFCRHTYRIRRLSCACCDTDDPDKLAYFTAKEETGFRVETCRACHTYVKTIDFRALDRQAFAPLNDLESMALDVLAEKEGFRRMAPSVWSI